MAESFDKKDISFAINDDMIREALKKGLTSIQASDDLVSKTLECCQSEIQKGRNSGKAEKSAITPWLYRLGAPLAVGALALVLFFNGNQQISEDQYSAAAPQAAVGSTEAGAESDTGSGNSAAGNENTMRSAGAPDIAFSQAAVPSPSESPDLKQKSDDNLMRSFSADIAPDSLQILQSLPNRTENSTAGSADTWENAFDAITGQYNKTNGTLLTLDKADVTRIHTLSQGGINAETLLNAGSYQDILSDEGYWALPLKNSGGEVEKVLYVISLDDGDQDITVSSNNYRVEFEQKEFLVSEPTAYLTDMGNAVMFDDEKLIHMVRLEGYQTVSSIEAADMNDGRDFLVFVNADEKELAIPFLTTVDLFGLENRKIYDRDEIFKVIGNRLQSQN